jgi:DNA-binding response OmpR family regulator
LEGNMIETTGLPVEQDANLAAFLRYLPRRIAAFERRILRHRFEGWNPAVLSGDLRRLADASNHYGLIKTRGHLLTLAQMVGEHFAHMRAPDPKQVEQMFVLLSTVSQSLPFDPGAPRRRASDQKAPAPDAQSVVTDAPIADAMPPPILEAIVPAAIASIATSELIETVETGALAEPVAPPASIEPVVLVEPVEPGEVGMRRIFHLSDGNAFALELEQRLESEGYAFEAVESVDELSDLFMCLLPQLLLVDASHLSQLAIIGALRREAQESMQPPRHIQMVVLATQDDPKTRRAAHRAGVDLLLFPPFDITDLSGRLQALTATVAKDQVRVLIVEDNRADAFFAQSVLTRVGMQVEVEQDPMKVLETLKSQRPDLILMDLHMPFANGVEVTMLIREHPLFARVPIVFLSGESDPDSHLEAINAGGDDFLFKPIRPRHLIAAVQDRVRRMHPINKDG